MSRVIRFRGKRKDNGEWVYGDLNTLYLTKPFIVNNIEPMKSIWDEVVPETVGQFIGLVDEKGEDIYEGDMMDDGGIIEYGEMNCDCCNGVYGWWAADGDIRRYSWSKVVGNIHEMPKEVSND